MCLWQLRDVLSCEQISGCFFDAAMAKIVRDGSLLKTHMKNKEKKPQEPPLCRSHTHAVPQGNLFHGWAQAMYDVVSSATRPCTHHICRLPGKQ